MSSHGLAKGQDEKVTQLLIASYTARRPPWLARDALALFLHQYMTPWEDSLEDVRRGIDYALSPTKGEGGTVYTADSDGELVGGLVMLNTGMGGYVPANLLLFVCVAPPWRGQGIGRLLIQRALEACDGDVKLHVEPDNPAHELYRRLGFRNDYLEMRLKR